MDNSSRKSEPVDLSGVKRYRHADRESIASTGLFGRPVEDLAGEDFFDSLPQYLKATDLRDFIKAVVAARSANRPFHVMAGAHTIKVGTSPILIDLMERNLITGISLNSAGLIHDLEVAFFGATSEDVQAGLSDGSFGMVEDTAQMFAAVCDLAFDRKIGLGEAAGLFIEEKAAPHSRFSLFCNARRSGIPATIHIGIGTDIVAQHPEFDGARAGAGSHHDFKLLCTLCGEIDQGGTVANIGSAVILPEVFLKALTVARNLGSYESRLTTANFDMITHYRPTQNVVSRPTQGCGKGYNFAGHHEIMIPLLAWGLRRLWDKRDTNKE